MCGGKEIYSLKVIDTIYFINTNFKTHVNQSDVVWKNTMISYG